MRDKPISLPHLGVVAAASAGSLPSGELASRCAVCLAAWPRQLRCRLERMPSPIASAGIVLAAFLTGLLGPRLLSGGASGSHADRIRVSELQQANTVLQQKLRVASDTLQQLQRSHGATIEDLSQKISAMEGSSSEEGGAGGGGGGGMLRKCRRQLEACRQKELTPTAVERPLLSAAAKPGGMHAENDTLLAVHRKWDWKSIVQVRVRVRVRVT